MENGKYNFNLILSVADWKERERFFFEFSDLPKDELIESSFRAKDIRKQFGISPYYTTKINKKAILPCFKIGKELWIYKKAWDWFISRGM